MEIFAATNSSGLDTALAMGGVGIIIAIIVAILPYIAILMIWMHAANISEKLDILTSIVRQQEDEKHIANATIAKIHNETDSK